MKVRRTILVCALLAGGAAPCSRGAPACDLFSDVTLEDGSARRIRARGDEFFNWTEDEAGFAVARGAGGRWQYAVRERGRWVPAGMTPRQRGLEGRAIDPPSRTSPFAASSAEGTLAAETDSVVPETLLGTPPAPAKLAVILVAFTNQSLLYADSVWTNTFFGAGGKTVRTFYEQASKGRFWFMPAAETSGVANDGVVRVSLASNHPNTATTDDTVRNAVKAALIAADPFINYAAFDANANGVLASSELHLVVVFAGYEYAYNQSYTPFVWAHRWSLFSPVTAPTLDGVVVGSTSGGYMAVGERHATHAATIGVICHELGHNLGLPDLYDTDGSSDGVGGHCLMGSGNWGKAAGDAYQGQTPVLPSAYCRLMTGFADAVQAVGEGQTYTVVQASDSTNIADMVRLSTPNSQQYFLVENRQLTGFDTGLYQYLGVSSGGGLAVWHIDASASGNTVDTRRLVDLEEAANAVLDAPGSYYGRLENYYYLGNVTRFDETTSPNNLLYGGGASYTRVYSVSAAGASMTFAGDNGASVVTLEAALDVSPAQAVTTGSPAWTRQTATTHDGADAAQAGSVSKTAPVSWMSTVVTGPVQVAFWWRHAGDSTETLAFLVDGAQRASTGVNTSWARRTFTVGSGVHTARWEYVTSRKNGSSSQAFVDQLTVQPASLATIFSVR